ncbi:MAG: hypothetical protein HN392_01970 [Anaerolineae bacterium]|jgi:division/cell wall cluster transcriptional repressor MraZ|nr:hypothetical protein [Anaerolineae bacterium]
MFYGQHTIQIDANKVFEFPKPFSNELTDNLFIFQGFDCNLLIMPEKTFFLFYKSVTSLNIANPLTRKLLRLSLGNAILAEVNETRQIQLSEYLYKYAKLFENNSAVFIGQGDHFEIWSAECWENQKVDLLDTSMNSHRFASLDLRF